MGVSQKSVQNLVRIGNEKTEIKGLSSLTSFISLDLSNNLITEIKGLENLTKLTELFLGGNQIDPNLIERSGELNRNRCAF